MARRSAVEQIVIEEKTVGEALLKLIAAREKGEQNIFSYTTRYVRGMKGKTLAYIYNTMRGFENNGCSVSICYV